MRAAIGMLVWTAMTFSTGAQAAEEGPPAPQKSSAPNLELDTRRSRPPIVASEMNRIGPYCEKRAILLSALGTGLSVGIGGGLMMGGLFGDVSALTWTGAGILSLGGAVAPSFGHFYARNIFRGALMTGIRTALIAAAVIPQIVYNASSDSELVGLRAEGHFIFVVLPVSVTAAALAIMDILTVRRSVRRADAAYRKRLGIGQ
jgi:hypothetical protein